MKKKILSVLLAMAILSAPAVTPMEAESPFVVSASAAESTKLAKPTSLKAKVSGKKVTLSWKKVSGAEAYGVYKYDTAKGKYVKVKNVTSNKITVTVDGDGTYKFRVYSLDKVNGKYKKGKYAYKKVTVKTAASSSNVLDEAFKGLSFGMSKSQLLDKISEDYFVTGDVILVPKGDDEFYCYQLKNNELTSYGVAYKYSDSKFKALKKLFSGSEWLCLNENAAEFNKDNLKMDMLIYTGKNKMGTIIYEENNNLVMALVIKM